MPMASAHEKLSKYTSGFFETLNNLSFWEIDKHLRKSGEGSWY